MDGPPVYPPRSPDRGTEHRPLQAPGGAAVSAVLLTVYTVNFSLLLQAQSERDRRPAAA